MSLHPPPHKYKKHFYTFFDFYIESKTTTGGDSNMKQFVTSTPRAFHRSQRDKRQTEGFLKREFGDFWTSA